MQVQVSTDSHIVGREALERWAQEELATKLSHFSQDLTRVEVHLSDENPGKGSDVRRCVIEARPTAHAPLAVSHDAAGVNEAFRGAVDKLKHALDSALGRNKNHRDRETVRRDVDVEEAG